MEKPKLDLDEILIIEDKEEYWEVGKRTLEREGYKVDIATSSEEGIAKMKQKQKEGKKFGVITGLFLPTTKIGKPRQGYIRTRSWSWDMVPYEPNDEIGKRFKIVWNFLLGSEAPVTIEKVTMYEEPELEMRRKGLESKILREEKYLPWGFVNLGYAYFNKIPVVLFPPDGTSPEGIVKEMRLLFGKPREHLLKIILPEWKDKIIKYIEKIPRPIWDHDSKGYKEGIVLPIVKRKIEWTEEDTKKLQEFIDNPVLPKVFEVNDYEEEIDSFYSTWKRYYLSLWGLGIGVYSSDLIALPVMDDADTWNYSDGKYRLRALTYYKKWKRAWRVALDQFKRQIPETDIKSAVYVFGTVAEEIETSNLAGEIKKRIKEIYSPKKLTESDILGVLTLYGMKRDEKDV